tara:strand:- start:161 stop:913 length:753 start_codon:yes stop_codon:yes gene_type:complete
MTQQQMIESIQQIYPDMGETQLRLLLNDALDEFVEETRVLTDTKTLAFTEKVSNNTFSSDNSGWTEYWGSSSSDPTTSNAGGAYRVTLDGGDLGSAWWTHGQGFRNTTGIKLYKNIEYTVTLTVKPQQADSNSQVKSLVIPSAIAGGTTLAGNISIGDGLISPIAYENYTLTYNITPTSTADYYIYNLFNNSSTAMYMDFLDVSIKPNSSNRYYYLFENFDDEILSINKVDLDNIALDRYTGPIEDTDVT